MTDIQTDYFTPALHARAGNKLATEPLHGNNNADQNCSLARARLSARLAGLTIILTKAQKVNTEANV